MKKIFFLSFMTLFLVLSSCGGKNDHPRTFVLDSFIGETDILHSGESEWQAAKISMFLYESDTIRTGEKSECSLTMPQRGVFSIEENTTILLQKLSEKDEQVYLDSGSVLVEVNEKLNEDEVFVVETDTSVAAIRGTIFGIGINADKTSTLEVEEGEVALSPNIDLSFVEDQATLQVIEEALTIRVPNGMTVSVSTEQRDALKGLIEEAIREGLSLEELKKRIEDSMMQLGLFPSEISDETSFGGSVSPTSDSTLPAAEEDIEASIEQPAVSSRSSTTTTAAEVIQEATPVDIDSAGINRRE